MKSSFGKKLFRLLLLFAILPSLLLIVVGYYLSTENLWLDRNEQDDYFLSLTEYSNNKYFNYLNNDIDRFINKTDSNPVFADFLFITSDTETKIIKGKQTISENLISRLVTKSEQKGSGLFEMDSIIYQYSFQAYAKNHRVYAGILHDQEYISLIAAYQSNRATRTSTQQLNNKYLLFIGIIFIIFAFFTLILAYYFSSKTSKIISRPLVDLANAANAISEGNFKQQVKLSGSSEMVSLISSFNEMAEKLEQTTARLTQSERVAAWRHIARRFAHELKNPLQPILVSLYQIEKKLSGKPIQNEIKNQLKSVSEEIKHLTDLADRFSMLAKLPEPKIEVVDLSELLKSLAELYSNQLKSYSFNLNLPDSIMNVQLDIAYFREAIHNLLINAMEASSKGDVITMTLSKNSNEAIITIEDHGEGMSTDVLASAKMPYYTTKQSGSGIGLAIVEKTINEIDGQLEISSESGKGTIITIRIPLTEKGNNA